jgi:prepilin signal peptidase PulO-like enzyme (type II secretory pathway)
MSDINVLWTITSGLMGASFGSFAHVVYYRTPLMIKDWKNGTKMNTWWSFPGSRCPVCKTELSWYENVPIVGWLVLRAKCRHCQTRIPVRYFLWECAWFAIGGALGWLVGMWAIVFYISLMLVALIIELLWRAMAAKNRVD